MEFLGARPGSPAGEGPNFQSENDLLRSKQGTAADGFEARREAPGEAQYQAELEG